VPLPRREIRDLRGVPLEEQPGAGLEWLAFEVGIAEASGVGVDRRDGDLLVARVLHEDLVREHLAVSDAGHLRRLGDRHVDRRRAGRVGRRLGAAHGAEECEEERRTAGGHHC
jgi:hypothetical protein